MRYKFWLDELKTLIVNIGNHSGWENWDDWRYYFDEGLSPEQALKESSRLN